MAHIKSILPQRGGVSPVDNNTVALFHYDEDVNDSIKGLKAIGNRYALYFNGASKVDCGPFVHLGTSGFTFEAWVYITSSVNQSRIFDKLGSNFAFGVSTTTISVWLGAWYELASAISGNTWNHIAVTRNGTALTFYVNGVLKGTVTTSSVYNASNTGNLIIGYNSINFNGRLSNVKIWNRALSVEEINASRSNQSLPEDSLVGYWKLDETDGVIAHDYSSYGNDGIISGAVSSDGYAVYSLTNEGYSGDSGKSILLEEATTNLVPSDKIDMNTWAAYSGATLTKTYNVNVPEWNTLGATRMQISGGTNLVKVTGYAFNPVQSGVTYTMSIYVKNIGVTTASIQSNGLGGVKEDIVPGVCKRVVLTGNGNGTSNGQFNIATINMNDSLDIILYQPQIEQKTYATSFINGVRNVSNLRYVISMLSNPFTLNFWAKTNGYSSTYPWYINMYPSGVPDDSNRIYFRPSGSTTIAGGRVVGGVIYAIPSATISDVFNWHMYTLTSNGTNMNIYRDGILLSSSTSVTDLPIGTNMLVELYGSNPTYNTMFDEVRIDSIARTSTEIASWYYQGRNGW